MLARPRLQRHCGAVQRLLETGAYATVHDLARPERINPSYVSRVLRLMLLAPKIVEGILDARQEPSLSTLVRPITVEWDKQAKRF